MSRYGRFRSLLESSAPLSYVSRMSVLAWSPKPRFPFWCRRMPRICAASVHVDTDGLAVAGRRTPLRERNALREHALGYDSACKGPHAVPLSHQLREIGRANGDAFCHGNDRYTAVAIDASRWLNAPVETHDRFVQAHDKTGNQRSLRIIDRTSILRQGGAQRMLQVWPQGLRWSSQKNRSPRNAGAKAGNDRVLVCRNRMAFSIR